MNAPFTVIQDGGIMRYEDPYRAALQHLAYVVNVLKLRYTFTCNWTPLGMRYTVAAPGIQTLTFVELRDHA